MRLKIKQVHPNPEIQQQQQQQLQLHQENHVDSQQIMKKEIVDEQEGDDRGSGSQWLKPEEREQHSLSKSGENTNNDNISNQHPDLLPDNSVAQNLGKRKRKPREQLINQISPPVIIRRRKKKSVDSNSAHQTIHNSEGKSISKHEKTDDGLSNPVQKSPTLIRAEELQTSLGDEYPTFVKLLGRSHIGSCFRMGLPVPFCKSHLPKREALIVLENENGEQFEIRYIAEKTGLGAGWRKFVSTHKLVEGDAMTFQLIEPTTFKVYVTRANDMTEVDGALSLLNLEALTKQSNADESVGGSKKKRRRRRKSLPLTVVETKKQELRLSNTVIAPLTQLEEYSGNDDSEEVASEVMENSKISEDTLRFRDVKSFQDFHIHINNVCIDSELPEHIRRKYYELCCSKKSFLHERFLPGLHCKLAAGMIFEAVNTADSIRACKITTSKKEFDKWEKSLRSFELLGMNVGFLRDRLCWLSSLAFDSDEAIEAKKYCEVKTQRDNVEAEIKDIEAKLVEMKEASRKYDAQIDELKPKAESYEVMFQQEVKAPW